MTTALITGITGQDGSYLAELLLSKGYDVYGLVRRLSTPNTTNIKHILNKITLIESDLTDQSSLDSAVSQIQPEEVYNLAAQSFVATSWTQPILTTEVTGLGAVRVFEAVKNHCHDAKVYQASSSEMFGKVQETPQSEITMFYPRSPYGCAKLYAHWMGVNYRESYNMHISMGVLFNHECLSSNTPLILKDKRSETITIKTVEDIRRVRTKGANIQQWMINDLKIWDGESFVDITAITATKRKKDDSDFLCRIVNTRNGVVQTTNHHNLISENGDKVKTKDIEIGDKLLHNNYPDIEGFNNVTISEAIFLGMMVADGYISEKGGGNFSKNDDHIRESLAQLWRIVANGHVSQYQGEGGYGLSKGMNLSGNNQYLRNLRTLIYDRNGFKKVPDNILNSNPDIKEAFLKGYNTCDGLKANPCTYEFKNFKTNSILLAQGLIFLISQTTKQKFNITFDEDEKYYGYYSINLLSPNDNGNKIAKVNDLLINDVGQREIQRRTGISRTFIRKVENGYNTPVEPHLSKPKTEVKKMLYHNNQPEWVYDIAAASGKFMAGVGNMIVSNSPRRGIEFVTRKISNGVAEIYHFLSNELRLGNLDTKRDWGFAGDYVNAMWLMLQQDDPGDYVISTGESHSIREFLEIAFGLVDLDYKKYVVVDPAFYRPAEVETLQGDYSKAKEILNWKPEVSFDELVHSMVSNDIALVGEQK